MTTYTIAELGACHDGALGRMYDGVHVAAEAGASAVKLQWTSDPDRMAQRRGKAAEDGYGEIYRKYLAWDPAWHETLRAKCDAAGIDYMCTVYLPEDVEVVAPWVKHFKIASFEAEDPGLVEAHAGWVCDDHWAIISTGMLTDGRAIGSVKAWARQALPCEPKILRCISAYPAPHGALELQRLWERHPSGPSPGRVYDGLSDHTAPHLTWTGALAVAAGAEIVEAHFRLPDTDPKNPDYPHAMTPGQLTQYIRNIRFAEECLGTGDTSIQECEAAMAQYKVKPNLMGAQK